MTYVEKCQSREEEGELIGEFESLAAEYLDRKLNTELARTKMSKQDRGQEMQ